MARARAKEWTDWAKVARRPWKTASAQHTKTHDRRAHHHESSKQCIVFCHRSFIRGSTRSMYHIPDFHVTGLRNTHVVSFFLFFYYSSDGLVKHASTFEVRVVCQFCEFRTSCCCCSWCLGTSTELDHREGQVRWG